MNISAIGASSASWMPEPPKPPALTSTASLLGMSADELRQAQQSGTSLTQLASQKGISKDDLVKSIAADLKASAPQGAPQLSDDRLQQIAANIVDGKRPGGHHHHGHHQTPPATQVASTTSDLAATTLDLLA